MRIEVYGTGCPKCKKLKAAVQQALEETGVTAELVAVTEITEIMKAGVMMTPALAIDGQVKSSGKLLAVPEIKALLGA